MTTFHSRQSGDTRRTRKNENTGTLNFTSQIPPSICTVMFTKRDKSSATIFKSRCSRTVFCYRFDRVEALPLVWTRILRLAQISPLDARSPARRPRDDREISGKTSGEISRRKSALCADNGRAVTTATPSNVRQVGSQDNSRCVTVIQAVVAPGTCGTTSKTAAQQPCHGSRNGQSNISQDNLLKS